MVTFEKAHANGVRREPEFVGGAEKSLGDFGVCVAKARSGQTPSQEREHVEKRLRNVYRSEYVVEKAPMSEDSGTVGGYLVPTDIADSMLQAAIAEESVFWPRAYVQPMTSKTMLLPIPDPTRSALVQQGSNMYGGMLMEWGSSQLMDEASQGETEPTFSQIELVASELAGYLQCSNQLAADSIGLDAFLRQFIPRAVANQTDQAFFRGPGVSNDGPMGLVGAPCTLAVARSNNADVTQANLSAMHMRLLPGSHKRAVWGISPTAMNRITQLTMPGILIMVPGADGSDGLLYGSPFFITEKLPDVGTPGDVLLFDPSLYVIGNRGLYLDFSDQQRTQWRNNQCLWRVVWRGDGQPMLKSTVVLANQSSTLAAMAVQLTA